MNNTNQRKNSKSEETFYLSKIIGIPAILHKERIGRLTDLVIVDKDRYAEVTHLCIGRPFGRPSLVIPWEKVKSLTDDEVTIDIDQPEPYVGALQPPFILLRDYIMDKKVLDVKGRELEVVYDLKMTLTNGKLYVVDVDLSKYGLLRRVGLAWLASLIYKLADKIRSQTVPWSYVEPLPEQIGSFKGDIRLKVLKEQLSEIPAVDVADILEELGHEERMALFHALDVEHASDTLEEIDPRVQREMIASMNKEKAARLINEMTPGQAADLLGVLPWWEVKPIVELLDKEKAVKVQSILEKQEENILDFATSYYLRLPAEKPVMQAREEFPQVAKGKAVVMYIYVLDETEKLVGVLDIRDLLLAEETSTLGDVMTTNVVSLNPDSTLREASELFRRYHFRALPITNDDGKMVGVVPYRDVVELRHRYVE